MFFLAFQYLAEKTLGRCGVATLLHEDVKHITILVDGSPQIVLLTADFDEYLFGEPRVSEPSFTSFQGPSIARSKLETPTANALVRNFDTSLSKQILNISKTHTKAVAGPDRVADDSRRKTVSIVARFS